MKVLSPLSLARRPRSTSPLQRSASAAAAVTEPQSVGRRGVPAADLLQRIQSRYSKTHAWRASTTTYAMAEADGPEHGHMQRVCSLPYNGQAARTVDVNYHHDGATLSTTSSTGRSSEDAAPHHAVPKRKAFRDRFMKTKPSGEARSVHPRETHGDTCGAAATTTCGSKTEQRRMRKKLKDKVRRDKRAIGKYALKIVACTQKATDHEFERFLARQTEAGRDFEVVASYRGTGAATRTVEYKAVDAASQPHAHPGGPSRTARSTAHTLPHNNKVADRALRQRERQSMRDTLDEIEDTLGDKFGYKLTQTEMVKHLSSVANSLDIPVERILADKTASYEILQSHLLTTLRRARDSEVAASECVSVDSVTSQNALGSDDEDDEDDSTCSYDDSRSEFSKWAYELEDEDSRAAASFVRELFSSLSGMSGSRASTEQAILASERSVQQTVSLPMDRTKGSQDRSVASPTVNSSVGVSSFTMGRNSSLPSQSEQLRYRMAGNDTSRTRASARRKVQSYRSNGAESDSSAAGSEDDDDEDDDSVTVEMGGLVGAVEAALKPLLHNRFVVCGGPDGFGPRSGCRPGCALYSYHCQ